MRQLDLAFTRDNSSWNCYLVTPVPRRLFHYISGDRESNGWTHRRSTVTLRSMPRWPEESETFEPLFPDSPTAGVERNLWSSATAKGKQYELCGPPLVSKRLHDPKQFLESKLCLIPRLWSVCYLAEERRTWAPVLEGGLHLRNVCERTSWNFAGELGSAGAQWCVQSQPSSSFFLWPGAWQRKVHNSRPDWINYPGLASWHYWVEYGPAPCQRWDQWPYPR